MPLFIPEASVKVSFTGPDPNIDWVVSIDNEQYGTPGAGIPINNLVANNPSYWVQLDIDGKPKLCTAKGTNLPKVITYLITGAGVPRTATAKTFKLEYMDPAGLPAWFPSAD